MKLKVPIATVIMLVKTQNKQSFVHIREVGYIDQNTAIGRDAINNVMWIVSLTIYGGVAAVAGTIKPLSTPNLSPSVALNSDAWSHPI